MPPQDPRFRAGNPGMPQPNPGFQQPPLQPTNTGRQPPMQPNNNGMQPVPPPNTGMQQPGPTQVNGGGVNVPAGMSEEQRNEMTCAQVSTIPFFIRMFEHFIQIFFPFIRILVDVAKAVWYLLVKEIPLIKIINNPLKWQINRWNRWIDIWRFVADLQPWSFSVQLKRNCNAKCK